MVDQDSLAVGWEVVWALAVDSRRVLLVRSLRLPMSPSLHTGNNSCCVQRLLVSHLHPITVRDLLRCSLV